MRIFEGVTEADIDRVVNLIGPSTVSRLERDVGREYLQSVLQRVGQYRPSRAELRTSDRWVAEAKLPAIVTTLRSKVKSVMLSLVGKRSTVRKVETKWSVNLVESGIIDVVVGSFSVAKYIEQSGGRINVILLLAVALLLRIALDRILQLVFHSLKEKMTSKLQSKLLTVLKRLSTPLGSYAILVLSLALVGRMRVKNAYKVVNDAIKSSVVLKVWALIHFLYIVLSYWKGSQSFAEFLNKIKIR